MNFINKSLKALKAKRAEWAFEALLRQGSPKAAQAFQVWVALTRV
jgi:hypothetical protein